MNSMKKTVYSNKQGQTLLAHPNNYSSTNSHNGTYSGKVSNGGVRNIYPIQNRNKTRNAIGSTQSRGNVHLHTSQGYQPSYNKQHENGFNYRNTNHFQDSSHPYQRNSGYSDQFFEDDRNDYNNLSFRSQSQYSHTMPSPSSTFVPSVSRPFTQQHQVHHSSQSNFGGQWTNSGFDPYSHRNNGPNNNTFGQDRSSVPSFNQHSYHQNNGFNRSGDSSPMKGNMPYGNPCVPSESSNCHGPNVFGRESMPQRISQQPAKSMKGSAAATTSSTQVKEFKLEKKENESSLRVLTASITALRAWEEYSHRIPLIFEVFGMLNSNVTTLQAGVREFHIKDDKDSVRCVFFETDRNLAPMMKGQWYRSMGKWSSHLNAYHCVSIRPILDDERKVYKLKINASDKAMRTWRSKNNEF